VCIIARRISMSERFDAFTKRLGTHDNRRGLLHAVGGSALALLGLGAISDEALGKSCKKNKDCPDGKKCKHKRKGKKGHCK
jgi:hypothetical protein